MLGLKLYKIAGSPITYVKDAELRGSLFSKPSNETGDLVSVVDSNFFVDHEEPLAALAWLREDTFWPFGDLPDGHEFLLVFESSRRRRSQFLRDAMARSAERREKSRMTS